MEGEGPREGLWQVSEPASRAAEKLSPPLPPRKTPRTAGRDLGMGSSFCPLPLVCVTLGESPLLQASFAMLLTGGNAAVMQMTQLPCPSFCSSLIVWVRPSSHICGKGEVLPSIFLHSSQRISPCRCSLSISIFKNIVQASTKSAVFLGIAGWGLCPLAVWPLAGSAATLCMHTIGFGFLIS